MRLADIRYTLDHNGGTAALLWSEVDALIKIAEAARNAMLFAHEDYGGAPSIRDTGAIERLDDALRTLDAPNGEAAAGDGER